MLRTQFTVNIIDLTGGQDLCLIRCLTGYMGYMRVWMGLGQLTTFQNQRASSHSASISVGVSNNCMFHAHSVIQTIVGTPSVAVRVTGVIIKVRHGCHDR